ncbi:c-type cytochrome [Pareuzebyella sediminis]|uniref:c-type cytochrome n=1 Tax=Pareuzebyella sediminis TaxID=2607998 RepID=UPI0011EC2FB1|nr:c-type cytochrome [Pareuzebyella sediminis]
MKELRFLARRLFWLFITMFTLITVLFIELFVYQPKAKDSKAVLAQNADEYVEWQPIDVQSEFASGTMAEEVAFGYRLISETSSLIGPKVDSFQNRFTGNGLACTNCHLKAGTQPGSASWIGVIERFPQFGGRSNKLGTIEDRINGCMERSMNGRKLGVDSKEMRAIVAYMKWLGEGIPEERKKEYKGYPKLKIPHRQVDLQQGKIIYDRECMVCHGANGQGVLSTDASKGYQYPPLWGKDSYNNGAGMHRVITAAEFIKSNMPFGQATWQRPKLTDEEAFDVAGYINSFDRPLKAHTEDDYPNKKLKPVSTPYGPWEDHFSAEQHKYGPFLPIMAHYKKEFNITKTK